MLKHSFPNGRAVYCAVGGDGKPLTVGQQVKRKDKIGEVSSQARFHYEIRPVDNAAMDQTPRWMQLYGADPGMEWSRYAVVDPQKFDVEAFGGKNAAATTKKN